MKKLLMVMVLGASAVAASAQGLQPRRTLGSRLARPRPQPSEGVVGKEAIKVIPTAREGGATWKYKESDKPLANWADLSFDDKDWQEGVSGFGNSCGLRRTPWNGGANDLYLRKKFNVEYTVGQIESVSVSCAYDADIEILLNGSILLKKGGWNWKYVSVDVTTEFKRLVHESGQDNVLAVKAHDNGIPCYMDMGLDIVLVDSVSPTKKDEPSAAESSAATQSVARVSEIALIPFGGTDWKYKMQGEVEENWKSPDFNDSSWLKGNSSFGSGGRYEVCTRWTTPCVCLRKKFDCPYEDADIKYLQIREKIDDMVDVWLNGSHIYHWQFCGNCDMTTVIPRQLWEGLLRRKDNVLTVVARDWGGPRIVNVGLTAMVRQSVGKELVCPTEYVPADMKLIFPATKLADIQVCSAVLTGDAVNWGRPTAILASNIKSFGDLRKTLQFQRLEVGCLKCACVELEQKGRDVWGRVLYCRSVEHCDVSGVDFDTLLCPTHRIIDNDLELSNQPSCGIALRELTAYFGALAGPYGIRMDVAPGCEKGAEYVLGRLRDDWLPRSLRYYGDPFVGKTPSRVYTIKVRRNDGGGKSKYTGPSGFFGFGCGNIGLAKDSDKYEFALDWLAASVLTVCEEPNSSSFQQYVKRFLEGEAKGQDPILQIKKDVQDGLAMEGADRRKKYPYMHTSMWAVFEELREKHPKFIQEYYQLKNSRFAEGRLPEKLSFDQVAGLLSEVTHENVTELFKKYGIGADPSKGPSANGASRVSAKAALGKIVVADKLQSCDFLLNKEFKKNAKFYLCLFSASWCPPCRAEMPRIAKTYAETLKDDPDIELIHFSRDQDDEKAMAWAKEHDVKFPVVKPNGGNPLDLHSRGIPHLFIVKADGTVLEEGHPMRIFNEEKFKEIKGTGFACGVKSPNGKSGDSVNGCAEKIDGYTWSYRVNNGDATIMKLERGHGACAVSPAPKGHIIIPSTLGGAKVSGIGSAAFACSGITSVEIPSGVKQIGSCAFMGCSDLTSLTIPEGLTNIGRQAFSGCEKLKSITIPASVTSIGIGVFEWCKKLDEIKLSEGSRSFAIVDGVLYTKDLSELIMCPNTQTSVKIPSDVRNIRGSSFEGCEGLDSVTIPEGVTNIGWSAFRYCRKIKTMTIPASMVSIDEDVFGGCGELKQILVEPGNQNFTSVDGVLYTKDRAELVMCPNALTTVAILPEVKTVRPYAFSGCAGMTSITIPNGVTNIRHGAFSDCSGFKSVVIPSSVAKLGQQAFFRCAELENVTFLGERPDSIKNDFGGCAKLKAIHVPANAKSWAGMKEWQGIPLVFDAESKK